MGWSGSTMGRTRRGLAIPLNGPEKPREFCGGKSDLAAHTSVGFAPKTLVYLRLLRHHLQILTATLQLYCFYSPQTTMSASAFNPFKSKKIAKSSSKVDQTKAPDHDPWSSKTPEKPALPPRRGRNGSVALSIKEVKQMATTLTKSAPVQSARTAPVGSARTASVDPVASPSRQKNVNRSMKLPEK